MFNRVLFATLIGLTALTADAQIYINGGYLGSRRFARPQLSPNYHVRQPLKRYYDDNNGFYVGASFNRDFHGLYGLEFGINYIHEMNVNNKYYKNRTWWADGLGGEWWDWRSVEISALFNIGKDLTDDLRLKGFAGPTFVYRYSYEGTDSDYFQESMREVNFYLSLGASLEWRHLLRLKLGVDYCPIDMSISRFSGGDADLLLTELRYTAGVSFILPTLRN